MGKKKADTTVQPMQDSFLRSKTVAVYENSTTVTDVTTGEILRQEQTVKARTSTEPDYIKVYYKTMMAVNEIDEIPLNFLLALSAQIGFANGERILFYNNKTTRRYISDYCNIGDSMTAKYIKRSVAKGILFPTADRGTYEVNPWLIAKGKWERIRELQASFEFVSGKWKRVDTLKSKEEVEAEKAENEESVKQEEHDKQLAGQMRIADTDMNITEEAG